MQRQSDAWGILISSMDSSQNDMTIRRGFPNAADNGKTSFGLNINDLIMQNPASTFFMKVEDDQYQELNIHRGDYVVIDRSVESIAKKIVVYNQYGEFKLARWEDLLGKPAELELWGVVTWVISPRV